MLPRLSNGDTATTPKWRNESLVQSRHSFPLDGLLDAIRHTSVQRIGRILCLQTWKLRNLLKISILVFIGYGP